MITVSTEVIQQSVRPDNFMNGATKNGHNLKNRDRQASESEFDYYNNTSTPINNAYENNMNSEEDDDDDIIIHQNEMSYSVTATNTNTNNNMNNIGSADLMNFEKVEIASLPIVSPKPQKSGLSVMINDNDEIVNNARYNKPEIEIENNKLSVNINIIILFSEFNFSRDISVSIQIFDSDMSVGQVINQSIHKFESGYPLKKLSSYSSYSYELRCIDDDDMDDIDELVEDELDPPLKRSAKICNFIDFQNTKNIKTVQTVYMVMCCNKVEELENISPNTATSFAHQSNSSIKSTKSVKFLDINPNNNNNESNNKISGVEWDEKKQHMSDVNREIEKRARRRRAQTMSKLEQETKATFIRVFIPGPINESSVLLSIENQELISRTLRDLFTILNRKRKSAKFNAQYFDFYYRSKTQQYGAISNSLKIMDLLFKELIILPKILSPTMGDINEAEAYQFELVRLANQAKQYKALKIDKYRTSKKKAFLLEIDRYRFVKTSLESSSVNVFSNKNKNQMKEPIPIQNIISCVQTEKSNGHQKHHNQFTIQYSIPHTQKNSGQIKTKTYQMQNTQIRNEIVDKLNFLCVIRRLQG